jgi:hypothetical protein
MNRLKLVAQSVLALALLILLLYGLGRVTVALVRTFEGLNKQVAAALVAGFASVTVATVSVVGGRILERRAGREHALHEKKSAIYEDFIKGVFDIFDLGVPSERTEDETLTDMKEFFARITPHLIAWASDDVVVAWSRYRRSAAVADADQMANLFAFEGVLRAVRRDVGHQGRKVQTGDLLGLFVNDVDKFIPKA